MNVSTLNGVVYKPLEGGVLRQVGLEGGDARFGPLLEPIALEIVRNPVRAVVSHVLMIDPAPSARMSRSA